MSTTALTLSGRAAVQRPRADRRKNWLLAAIEAHTRRQIALALGERIDEFNRAIRENRAPQTEKEQS